MEDTLSNYLNETREMTLANNELWGLDLYAPILFVDPNTRIAYGNDTDVDGILKRSKKLYKGELPKSINIANTALTWGGKRWAMIMLPLPKDKHERLNLVTHELFHQVQPQLNFNLTNADNNHLDKKDGRIYLRLELEALKLATLSSSDKTMRTHISNALTFRRVRYQLYPKADSTENLLELNEGIAEYTGLVLSGRNDKQILRHINESISQFLSNKTFVRSFAYQTIPIYGYLLSKNKRYWNRDISAKTNLSDYLQSSFGVKVPFNALEKAASILKTYNGELIISEETKREELNIQLVNSQIAKFVTNPHFELLFEKMNVSFDPRNIISLDEFGTVYPTIRITDTWGILAVQNGALMSPNWNKITITEPTETDSNIVKGDGWTLELNVDLYTIRKDIYSANYYLTKKVD
ncbi:MAG TPA: hypothetical protein VFZ33_20490 [Chitinophagaceae bacterium]